MRVDIKLAIVKSGRPQYRIAQELGVSESMLSKFIRGYGPLTAEKENRLTTMLGLRGDSAHEAEVAAH